MKRAGYPSSSGGGGERGMHRNSYLLFFLTIGALVVLQLFSNSNNNSSSNSSNCIHSLAQHPAAAATLYHPPSQTDVLTASTAAAGPPNGSSSTNASAWDAPPYRFPRLVHQTVVNKSRLSCEEKRVIESWKRLNPNHTHHLWDDEDMRKFMVQHYPDLVPVPYDLFLKGTERSDLWRVLVLHKFGGVYADMDVECLQPVDEWNAAHGHDAAVLLGTENVDVKRKPHRVHVTNWAMAAMPGHPLLAGFSAVVVREIQKQFFKYAEDEREFTPKAYEAGILDRTGPAALTTAMYDYFEGIGFDLNKVTERDLKSRNGVVAGSVRVLPVVALSSGWEVAVARSKGVRYTCEQMGKANPQALVCHMFWGSWRSTWRTFKQKFTYDNC